MSHNFGFKEYKRQLLMPIGILLTKTEYTKAYFQKLVFNKTDMSSIILTVIILLYERSLITI